MVVMRAPPILHGARLPSHACRRMNTTLAPLEAGLVSTVHEVQEDFAVGISVQLAQSRTADKASSGREGKLG